MRKYSIQLLGAAMLAISLLISGCGKPSRDVVEPARPTPPKEEIVTGFPATQRQETVLRLRPAGYWPADEGGGAFLLDLSGGDHHARLFNVPWRDGLLDFTSGFQWVEIPHEVRGRELSLGGWFYTRRSDYIGGEAMAMNRVQAQYQHTQGVALFNNAYDSRGAWVYFGAKDLADGVGVRLRSPNGANVYTGGTILDVVQGHEADVVGSGEAGVKLEPGRWHHVLYTVGGGVGRLYLDGVLVAEKPGGSFAASGRPFLVGNDMSWWMLHPIGSQSLDGSVRDLVLFDRALDAGEVTALASMPPESVPDAGGGPVPVPFAGVPENDLIKTISNPALPDVERALAALAVAARGKEASSALPALRSELQSLLKKEGARLPRVEDVRRNSLIAALLAIGPSDPESRDLLGDLLARPFLDQADLTLPQYTEVAELVGQGRLMDALDAYAKIPHASHGDYYFSEGDAHRDARDIDVPNDRAYAPVVESRGTTYRVGDGIPWKSAEILLGGDAEAAIDQLPEEYQEAARNWQHIGSQKLCRVRIFKTPANGPEEEAVLEGEWLIFEGSDQKMQGWTIEVDSDGYLHLLGGMHNTPNPSLYIPGSWEKMGLSRGANQPTAMYWVSKRPGDISEFEFVGQPGNPRNLPAAGMNYMNFLRDKNNNMFLYGRIPAQGIQSWGLFRYDTKERRWHAVGGDARDVVKDAEAAHGRIFTGRDGSPWKPGPYLPAEKVFVWTWQPSFYNYIRSWGARFDKTGRLHVRMLHRGLDARSRITDSIVYAYSDDLGATWHRADGTLLKLPLTLNPAPSHNADINENNSGQWWNLWLSLLNQAGYGTKDADTSLF